ncbi:MAG: STAS domain-containing protein [Clostridiales Family XIII bacterium]|jgi:anti-anti-sigma factor|nr:STAS domain-containing protein [Clostridiales Family XIII bacterium]
MNITTSAEGAQTVLHISGRVDTNTSAQLQDEIVKTLQTAKMLVLDFSDVQYVSSAGLRALMIGQKTASSKNARMEIIHVDAVVMSVLNAVGFSKILTIK